MNTTFVKSFLGGLKGNAAGSQRLKDKLLIIESDDWGAIRTPSNQALHAFAAKGFELDKSIYKVDALASKSDLESLFNLLLSIKNAHGLHPVITANAIMANPDFNKIKEADFKTYHWEPFYKTFERYPEHQDNLNTWKKGMVEGVFYPQFHGREHLNIGRWMQALQKSDEKVRFSFDWGSTYSGVADYAYMEAYDWSFPEEIEEHKIIIKEGLKIFKDTFGFASKSFIAPCYNWDSDLESFLAEQGIEWIQGISSQLTPTGTFDNYNAIPHHFAKKNVFGSRYNIRNVFFEPVNDPTKDWTDAALARIQAAFLMKRPAVISTHRVNYVGYIDPKNRDNGLNQLEKLLRIVVKKWPDVKFITTDQLTEYIDGNE
jgi:hypothetical protein